MSAVTPLIGGAAVVATLAMPAIAQVVRHAPLSPAQFQAALANAEVVGPPGQPELIIPMDAPGWARAVGVVGSSRHYKGLCGPDGAAATIEQLIAHAERDLTGFANRGNTTTTVGDSPRFKITHDATDAVLIGFYLPNFVAAAEYVDDQFNNRVTNNLTLDIADLPGDTIGSAGSTRYDIPWDIYVGGLREASDREDDDFADALPLASLPVRFGFPGAGTTNVDEIRVTDAQLRAVFGDTAVPETESVSITIDSGNSWAFLGCGISFPGTQSSLVDVAVHELTHSLGFTSSIALGGGNSDNSIQGLDVARFFQDFLVGPFPGTTGGSPISPTQFTTFARHGEFTILTGSSFHAYSSTPNGFSTQLEEGVGNQPSHLLRFDDFDDKLGIMDPVLNQGTTFCDSFYSSADLQPLDDMGWTPIAVNAILDCDGDGTLNIIEIAGGSADTNNNNIPDECENFRADVAIGPGFTGLTLSQWAAPGIQTLDGFNPNNFTLVFRGATEDTTLIHGSGDDIVARFSGFFNAPADGEYAFRVKHDESATLRVAGQTLLALDERRGLDGFTTSQIAPQNFVLLDAGFHAFELTVILDSSTDDVRVIADSPALGGWRDLNQSDFVAQLSDFPDCNNNGVDDQFDPDSDGDGTPDDCELDCDNDGVPDDQQATPDFNSRTILGTLAQPGETLTIETVGSNFDTEIALFNEAGTVLAANDDIAPGNLQSRITESLDAGVYLIGVGGFDTVFLNGPDFDLPSGCTASGDAVIDIASASGSFNETASAPSGRIRWYEFTVAALADCDGDGTPDSQELDCDNNGTPDDCELFEFDFGGGVVGTADEPIVLNTRGSDFDTEIAIWAADGTLLETNDDISFPANTQSEIVRMFEPGDYLLCVGGFNTGFSDFAPDFESGGVSLSLNGCSAGGSISLEIGTVTGTDILALPSGRVAFFPFTIAEGPTPCNDADLAEPFAVLDLADISAFIAAFTTQSPAADLNEDTVFDLSDISLFIGAFTGGCP